MIFLGVDVGSISVKSVLISEDGTILNHQYIRHHGQPLQIAKNLINDELSKNTEIAGIGFTGSGGRKIADALGMPFENEIICHSRSASKLTPEAKCMILVGGEDSYFVLMNENESDESVGIKDFAMNGICAAGCGSFLDQQASRLGIDIENEFGKLAVESARPSRVAGRCSVFAKTDMIHLQQKATPVQDIVAGLCFAFARNYVAVLARGKDFTPPIVFQGGVSKNAGMVRAFKEILELEDNQLIIHEYSAVAGAYGSALLAKNKYNNVQTVSLDGLNNIKNLSSESDNPLPPLPQPPPPPGSNVYDVENGVVEAYLGVDIGSISTNVVVMDSQKRVLHKSYLMTAGRPIEAVKKGLAEASEKLADKVEIRGVCTTGSGRYLIGDFLGADVVKNEITAQARAAAEIDPNVDTIFEIGGQDSKYISLENGAIVDFEMNKVCAAGTGSFLEEQAEKLGVNIKGEFAQLALEAQNPVRLGERCTVFMESDLVGHQGRGASTPDLAAGLAYSTVYNYINRVVGERKIGDHIFFQGGTVFNRAVVAAFQAVTGKHITVPEHHEVTGAIGCCLIAMENAVNGIPSKFKGWGLSKTDYTQTSFECKSCANACEINRVQLEGGEALVYGGRCEKFEKKKAILSNLPDLFSERESLMLSGYEEGQKIEGKPFIGIPRALHFMDFAPYWISFFKSLDIPIKLSNPTNKKIINDGLEAVFAEFCFPVKVAHGHVMELMEEDVTHLFLPCIIQLPKLSEGYDESVQCPYVSTLPYSIKAALNPEKHNINILAPAVDLSDDSGRAVKKMFEYMKELGVSKKQIAEAMKAGRKAQSEFSEKLSARGKEILQSLEDDKSAVVIISRGYNGCDNGINLELPERFKELGTLAIPLDMMPFDEHDISDEYKSMSWRSGQKILTSAEIIRKDDRLHGVYVTNFGCGPDSFLLKFFRDKLGGKSFLQIEIDEHSSDVGALTRCEAFLDSFNKSKKFGEAKKKVSSPIFDDDRTIYIPNMNNAADAVAAAFRSVGISAQPLPESDKESVAIGKKYCTGKECFPCIVTTGDMVKFLSRDDVDPSKTAFFMPSISGSGGCRFGCYNMLHRIVLDDLGYEDVPVFAPNQSKGFYESLGAKAGKDFIRRAWQGIVAGELLEKALHTVRPIEAVEGSAFAAYRKSIDLVIKTIENNGDLISAMKTSREYFEAVQTNSNGHLLIGIVGEVFVRSHTFSNSNLIKLIEESGGKAWLSPLSEWLYYVNLGQKTTAKEEGRWLEYINISLVDKVMRDDEKKLVNVWDSFIPHSHELTPEELVEYGKEYVNPEFFGEPILSLGKSEYLKEKGLAGIINVMPFTCMLGTITNGLLKNFQQKNDGMPVLNLAFDGQEIGDLPIRLEAFIEQCRAFKNKN